LPAFGVERRRRSVAWERGESKRVRGIACWGFYGARARARRGRRALQRALHGGVAVAAAGRFWAAWRSGEAPAQAKEGGGEHQGDAWKPARRRTWPGAALHGGRRCTAATAGEQRKELEVEEKGPKRNFQKFQGPVCKPAITFKIGLKLKSAQHESCSTFQDLQL